MNRLSWLVLALLAVLSSCRADSTGADTRRYACARDEECTTGFVCRAGFCQTSVTPTPPPDGENDAGLPPGDGGPDTDAGAPDAGAPDAGAPDAGAPDAGAPDAGAPDAGAPDAGAPDAGGPGSGDGGTDGGSGPVPAKLGFVTGAQTVSTGQCSAAVTVETQTAAGSTVAVASAVTVTLSAQTGSGATFYQDSACATATTTATVAAGASRATFYFRGTTATTVTVTAAATGLTSAQQSETVRAAPASVVFITSAQTLPTSGCSTRVDLELRDASGNPASYLTQKSMTFTGSNTGLSFYSDAACTTAITDAPFAANASRTSFYFKGKTSGTAVRVIANVSGLTAVRQDQVILPIVRAGVCKMLVNTTSVSCPLTPAQVDLSKTMLFFQASPTGNSPESALVRCWMSATDSFTCTRNAAGDAVYIVWKTVELANGLKVQHLQPTCSTSATTLAVPISTVAPANTFLLVSSELSGRALGDDDFFTAKLVSATEVDLQFSTKCTTSWKGSLQVVQLDGAQVVRGTVAVPTGQYSGTNASLPVADPSTTVLLFTQRVSNVPSSNLCDRMLRGELTSTSRVTFWRAEGTSSSACTTANIDEIAWERIDFGALAKVQPLLVSMNSGSTEAYPDFTSEIDETRTVVFASSQAIDGQAGGESTFNGDDVVGEALAGIEFNQTTELYLVRDSAQGTAKLNTFIVQFEP